MTIFAMKRKIVFFTFFITLLFFGCGSSNNFIAIVGKFEVNNNTVAILIEDFEMLKDTTCCYGNYSGFGELVNIRGRGLENIDHIFTKILYNPEDSLLYVEGKLTRLGEPLSDGQIIMGKLPESKRGVRQSQNIEIYYNYIVSDNGHFAATLSINGNLQMIIAPRERYNKNGDYIGTTISPIIAYDVYKLCDMYKAK